MLHHGLQDPLTALATQLYTCTCFVHPAFVLLLFLCRATNPWRLCLVLSEHGNLACLHNAMILMLYCIFLAIFRVTTFLRSHEPCLRAFQGFCHCMSCYVKVNHTSTSFVTYFCDSFPFTNQTRALHMFACVCFFFTTETSQPSLCFDRTYSFVSLFVECCQTTQSPSLKKMRSSTILN